MMNLRFPYYQRTYFGNQLTPMPGSLVLAAPAVLVWRGALQGFFWLLLLYLALRNLIFRPAQALPLFVAILTFCPLILQQYVIGTDYFVNSIYVFLPMLLISTFEARTALIAPSVLALGLALSSRANFAFTIPVFAGALISNGNWRRNAATLAAVLAISAVVTLPFYFYDPAGFSPLHTRGKINQFNQLFPYAEKTFIGITILGSLLMAWFCGRKPCSKENFLAAFAFTMAVPVILGAVLQSLLLGKAEFLFCSYGTFFVFPGAVAFSPFLPLNCQKR